MWIIWAALAIVVIATAALIVWQREYRLLSIWLVLMHVNPMFTIVKGATLVRSASGLAAVWLFLKERWTALPRFVYVGYVIAGWALLSVLWSPDRAAALVRGIEFFLVAVALSFPFLATNRAHFVRILSNTLIPITLLTSLTTILFRFSGSLERQYITSPLGGFILGTGTVAEIQSGRLEANVLLGEGLKAGGILSTNANRTALILGVASLAYFTIYVMFKNRFALATSVIAGIAVIATNSKTGIVLLLVSGVVTFVLWRFANGITRRSAKIVFGGLAGLVVALVPVVVLFGPRFIEASATTLEPRKVLWSSAFELVGRNPIFGSGTGSWEIFWRPISEAHGYSAAYPPHNFLLRATIELGLVGALLMLVFYVFLGIFLIRKSSPGAGSAIVRASLIAVWIWIFVHGMGDNTEYYGQIGNVPFLYLLFLAMVERGTGTSTLEQAPVPRSRTLKAAGDNSAASESSN